MSDQEFRAQQRRVLNAFRKWAGDAGLHAWIVCHVWYRNGTAGKGYEETTARAGVSWEYLHATFHWNLESIATHNDGELDRIVRHEICHVLVNEMRMWSPPDMTREKQEEGMKHEERVVTQLAAVMRWCRMAGEKSATRKKARR